jgi:hypothetical protein
VAAIYMLTTLVGLAPAAATTFSNPASITINDAANATPYPSTVAVAGLGTSVADVNATLSGFTHTFPADVDVLLVGPGGQSVVLMSDVPQEDPFCGGAVSGAILTFDDAAAGQIPPGSNLASGTYQPTNNNVFDIKCGPAPEAPDAFPAPAPAGPYGSTLAGFNGTNPNGTWSLYVLDDGGGDAGSIMNGWSLTIDAPLAATPQPVTTPPDFVTAVFEPPNLYLRLKCPARFKPGCVGTAKAVTSKDRCTSRNGKRSCKRGRTMTNSTSAKQKPNEWKLAKLIVKPQFTSQVMAMSEHPDEKLLTVRQAIHSKGFKHGLPQAVFHTYRVRALTSP